jgi:hypothetical protein
VVNDTRSSGLEMLKGRQIDVRTTRQKPWAKRRDLTDF